VQQTTTTPPNIPLLNCLLKDQVNFCMKTLTNRVSVSLANLPYRPISTSPSASPRRTTSTLYPSTPAPELDEASALRELQNAPMSPNLKKLIETEDNNLNQGETQDYQKTCTGTQYL